MPAVQQAHASTLLTTSPSPQGPHLPSPPPSMPMPPSLATPNPLVARFSCSHAAWPPRNTHCPLTHSVPTLNLNPRGVRHAFLRSYTYHTRKRSERADPWTPQPHLVPPAQEGHGRALLLRVQPHGPHQLLLELAQSVAPAVLCVQQRGERRRGRGHGQVLEWGLAYSRRRLVGAHSRRLVGRWGERNRIRASARRPACAHAPHRCCHGCYHRCCLPATHA